MSGFNPVANAAKVQRLNEKRDKELKELNRKREEAAARSAGAGLKSFGAARVTLDAAVAAQTVGLVSRDDFLATRKRLEAESEAEAAAKAEALRAGAAAKQAAEKKALAEKRRKERSALSFYDEDDDSDGSDDESDGSEDAPAPPKRARKIGKDPGASTDFLPDRDREAEAAAAREALAADWRAREDELKQNDISITYSFWDGRGHRRNISVKRGATVGDFLDAVRRQLASEGFREMKRATTADLMYVKEDLILPQGVTFHHLISTKARGKSGPLFHFDVHDDIRLRGDATKEKDESHAGKVCERHWYDRNKTFHPASRWEVWDPNKDYGAYKIFDTSQQAN